MTRKLSELDAASSSPIFRIGVFALIFDEGHILLGHRRDIDWWNLPGGGMEAGETVDEALRREVREETGLEVEGRTTCGRLFQATKARGCIDAPLPCNWWDAPGHRRKS